MRYDDATHANETTAVAGDPGFLGVDERQAPQLLKPGACSRATNKDFRFGVADDRLGWRTVGWARQWAVDFPLFFGIEDHFFHSLHAVSENSFADRNWRIQNGDTFQLRDPITQEFHAIWIQDTITDAEWVSTTAYIAGDRVYSSTAAAHYVAAGATTGDDPSGDDGTNWTLTSGGPALAIDPDGQPGSEWNYLPLNLPGSNYQILDTYTFQLLNSSTGKFHTVWVDDVGGIPTFAIDPFGMWYGDPAAATTDYGWRNFNKETFQLLNDTTDEYHTIWIDSTVAPTLAIDSDGMTETSEPNIDFDKATGFRIVYGELVFSDPDGNEGLLLATSSGIWRLREQSEAERIRLPAGETITGPVQMIQAFDRVLLFRGPDDVVLEWNPASDFTIGTRDFSTITQTAARFVDADGETPGTAQFDDNAFGDGTVSIPGADDATFHNNRVYIPINRDEIVVSDILDYTRYSPVYSRFRINTGSDDAITRIYPFNQVTLIVFKDQSIFFLGNAAGDLSGIRADILTSEYGLVARDAVVGVGNDVWFLSEAGVFSIKQALDNKLQASEEPLSGPIQPIIDRINPAYAHMSQAAYDDNKFILAAPLDGAKYPNALIVYDFLNQAWSGTWTAPWLDVAAFVRTQYGGKRRLFILQGDHVTDGGFRGAVILTGAGFSDEIYGNHFEIETELVTRGYKIDGDQQHFTRAILDHETWRPRFQVFARMDGVSEDVALSGVVTKDRTKYYVHGKADYDVTNANDDHADPFRKDYSVTLLPYETLNISGAGVNPHLRQRVIEAYKPKRRGAFLQLRVVNTQGRSCLHMAELEGRRGKRTQGTKA